MGISFYIQSHPFVSSYITGALKKIDTIEQKYWIWTRNWNTSTILKLIFLVKWQMVKPQVNLDPLFLFLISDIFFSLLSYSVL